MIIQLLFVYLKKFRLSQQLKKRTLLDEKGIKSFLNRDIAFISSPLDSPHQADKS